MHAKLWLNRVAVVALSVVACTRSIAQPSVMDIPGPFGVPLGSASIEKYSGILGLDADQKQLIKTLYQGYRAAYRDAVAAADKEIADGEQGDDRQNRMNKAMEALQKFADKARGIEDQFVEDAKAILTPEQLARIDRVLMARRRDVQMRFAFVAGEGVDLLTVLDQFKVSKSAELTAMCGEYETDLDRLMLEKVRVMKMSLGKAHKITVNGMPDFTLVGEIIGDLYTVGGKIRDLNRRYARQMEPLLPEAKQAEFSLEFKKLSFPRVYKPTLAQKVLSAAKGLDDLTPEQAGEVKVITNNFERDLEPLNQKYAAAIEDTQDRFPKEFMIIMQSRFDPNNKEDPLGKARAERAELEQKVFARLKTLLKPEQFQKLPHHDEDPDRMPDFLPNLNARKDWEKWNGEG